MSEMSLKIQGKRFDYFNKFNVSLVYNSVASVFSFEGLILNDEQRELFRPLSFHDVEVSYNNETLITGTILNTSTNIDKSISLGGVSGYSKTGVIDDCEIPLIIYPLQSDGLSLKQITEKLIKPFGLKLIVDSDILTVVNKKYVTSTAEPNNKISQYINELARQRNVVLTHDSNGNIVLTRLKLNNKSIATYTEGMPTTAISLSVNGQGIHSNISVQKQATIEVDTTGTKTISNSLVTKYRPTVLNQTSGDNNDTESSAEAIRSGELRNISLTIETDRWKWTDGKTISIIKPNQIIDVISPSNFINNRTRFFVERVDYSGTNEGITAILSCVLPETYSNKQPNNIFI